MRLRRNIDAIQFLTTCFPKITALHCSIKLRLEHHLLPLYLQDTILFTVVAAT